MPKHDDNSNTQQVTLCRHVASHHFFSLLSKNNLVCTRLHISFCIYKIWQPRIKFGTPFPSLSFSSCNKGTGVVRFMAALSPGLTPASTGSGWCVNAMREGLVWEVRALKSNFPGFLSEPGEDSPDEKIK